MKNEKKNLTSVSGQAVNDTKEPEKTQAEKNLEKRKLSMGLPHFSGHAGGRNDQRWVKRKSKISVGKNQGEDRVGDAMVVGQEHVGDGDGMPGPGKEILDTLNAWHEHRWRRLLEEYKMREEGSGDVGGVAKLAKDEHKIRGGGTSGGIGMDRIIRNWATTEKKYEAKDEYKMKGGSDGIAKGWNWPMEISEKEKVEHMKRRMKNKMAEMEGKRKFQEAGDGIEVPHLGKIWIHAEQEEDEDDMLIALPDLGEVRIPSRSEKRKDVKRRRKVFRRQETTPSWASLKPLVKNSESSIQGSKETSVAIHSEPKLIPNPSAPTSLAVRGLNLLKGALQNHRPTILTRLVGRLDSPRTSLLTRALKILRTALKRSPLPPPTVVEIYPPTVVERFPPTFVERFPPTVVERFPPTVVESFPPTALVKRFPLPPKVRRPSTLVSLLRLAWEKLTPRLTIRWVILHIAAL